MAIVLVVDDSNFHRTAVCAMLKQAGYEVLEASDGAMGLEIASENDVDCILSDVLMPKMDGVAMVQALRQRGSAVPVIVLTADIQESTRQALEDAGIAAFVGKPLKPAFVFDALKAAIVHV